MKFNKEEFFDFYKYDEEKKKYFSNFVLNNAEYNSNNDRLTIWFNNDFILKDYLYLDLYNYFSKYCLFLDIIINAKNDNLNSNDIYAYIELFNKNGYQNFKNIHIRNTDSGFIIEYVDEDQMHKDEQYLDDLKLFFYNIGYHKNIDIKLKEIEIHEIETLKPYDYLDYSEVSLDDLKVMSNIQIKGKIFSIEKINRKKLSLTYLQITDLSNACNIKIFNNNFSNDVLAKLQINKWAIFYGSYSFDEYNHDYYFNPSNIEFIDDPYPIVDDASEKRVELHAHTKYSEMDGVADPEDLVKTAYLMGHKAVAITDHLCIQGFHKAFSTQKKLAKDNDFKVIYGCEFNMVYQNLNIVYNLKDGKLNNQRYVVFDLETTGLSQEYDSIIEFGAVLLEGGQIIDKKDFFIKPPITVSEKIKTLTNIKDKDLNNAKTFKELKDEILDFIKDYVLVAHNASFDYGFLNKELNRINEKLLTNTVIDTLDLSRSLFKTRRAYRLGNMAKQYGVDYDEDVAHRADYDADVLASIFNLMLKDLSNQGVTTFKELNDFQGEDAFVKNRAFHTTVLVKNNKGLKNLYKLISKSHLDGLAVFGKANTKNEDSEYIAEPRIFKSSLNEYRDGLLIGSACFNGEVFEIASTKTKEELAKVISFYDYIEIQPLDQYRFLYEDRELFTFDRLKEYLKDIINEALKQNKIVVATGDVHYIRKTDKIFRDIYVDAQAIGGLRHPLYLFDKEKRSKQITADQHYFTTNEMLENYKWLNDEKLIKDMVINNPNMIADSIENVKPFTNELLPPKISDAIKIAKKCAIYEEPFIDVDEQISADEYLERLVWHNAYKTFGNDIPPFIKERIEKELNAIISNGYGVIYYTCHLLVKRSNNDGYVVGSRGSVGSSYVATLSGITEVNPLVPYYLCPKCHHFELIKDASSGYDAKDKECPNCHTMMHGEGQNIPFETFMGFNGDKIPDIDLNFSGEYQAKAHLFTREMFGENNVFRAGTILAVKDKTAFGYVNHYLEDKNITNVSRPYKNYLVSGCTKVKRTTGQHAGGIVVLPFDKEIEDITPIQYPANDQDSNWRSTHYEYHDYSDNLLKFDILGHVDPTAMALLERISKIDIKKIPLNDSKAISLFSSPKALNILNPNYNEKTGACGLPEFGTLNTRNTLVETKPTKFSELVQISGLSHGTNVWQGNAQELIKKGIKLADVIGCRDDIMGYLISHDIDNLTSFNIMEAIRKGKVAKGEASNWNEYEKELLDHNVPKWYIESCKKIEYLFPKAHAVAYCIMAVRIAWFKVYYPLAFYIMYLTLRCDAYELKTMVKNCDEIKLRVDELMNKKNSKDPKEKATDKEIDILNTLEICYEMASRGYSIGNIDLYHSLATEFIVNPNNDKQLIPPFVVLDGLGENVGNSIIEARKQSKFLSKEDLLKRTLLSTTLLNKLDELKVLEGLDEENQISLF